MHTVPRWAKALGRHPRMVNNSDNYNALDGRDKTAAEWDTIFRQL